MTLLLLFYILILPMQLLSQDINNCYALLNPIYKSHQIYKQTKSGMEFNYTIENDSIAENYFVIQILSRKGDYFHIIPFDISDKDYEEGFIKVHSLVIFTSEYSGKLTLFESADSAANKLTYEEYDLAPLEVVDCKNGWLKVQFKNQWIDISGWLPPESQCANPYTVCN